MLRKTKIIISDTHIGAGGAKEGNKLEDFISDAEFEGWLRRLVEESDRADVEMELIINGDWIEFLQVPEVSQFQPPHSYDASAYTSATVAAALQRLAIVAAWHPGIFRSLADFLHPTPPRRSITVLYGNHDPEMVFPDVQRRIRELLNVTGADADLVAFGPRRYFKDGVYIEHGNAYVEEVNRFQNADAPFDPGDPTRIERPAGSRFVTNFFNKVEWQRPWIDGVNPLTSLIFYALAFEPAFALRMIKAFLAVAPDVLFDVAGATATPRASNQILSQIRSSDQEAAVAQRLASDPAFAAAFTAQVQQALTEKGAAPAALDSVAMAALDSSPAQKARAIELHFWAELERAAEQKAKEVGAKVVLFGHIHERVDETSGFGGDVSEHGHMDLEGRLQQGSGCGLAGFDQQSRQIQPRPRPYLCPHRLR